MTGLPTRYRSQRPEPATPRMKFLALVREENARVGWSPDWSGSEQVKCHFLLMNGIVVVNTSTTIQAQPNGMYFHRDAVTAFDGRITNQELVQAIESEY